MKDRENACSYVDLRAVAIIDSCDSGITAMCRVHHQEPNCCNLPLARRPTATGEER